MESTADVFATISMGDGGTVGGVLVCIGEGCGFSEGHDAYAWPGVPVDKTGSSEGTEGAAGALGGITAMTVPTLGPRMRLPVALPLSK